LNGIEIITEYPFWFIVLCGALALLYAGILYAKDRLNRHFTQLIRILLGLFRTAAVFLIALFLLKPLIKTVERVVEKPVVVIAQDNSQSIVMGPDSTYYKNQYLNELSLLAAALADDYEVRTFSFGSSAHDGIDSLKYDEKITDVSSMLDEVYNRFSNRNLGAVIIGTDGLYNQGMNPRYANQKLDVPIFSIALGDTTVKRDVLIREVLNNRLAYLGNQFPIEVLVEANQCAGEQVQVSIWKKNVSVFSKTISIKENWHSESISALLTAETVGLQRYTVRVSTVENEVTLLNNQKDIFIDVLDSRQKILVLAANPHPDVAAIREAIQSNENYEVEVSFPKKFQGSISDYNLIIYHQLPDGGLRALDLITTAVEDGIPALFILGTSTNFDQFNSLALGFNMTPRQGSLNETHATFSAGFSLFSVSESCQKIFGKLPPLHMPFGEFTQSPGVTHLLDQRIGTIKTDKMLVGFNRLNATKIGVIAGEGIWRWRLVNYLENQTHAEIDEFLGKSIQYLASNDDKSRFRVSGATDFRENEPLIFEAELYNDVYELINDPDVTFKTTDENGQEFEFVFTRRQNSYRLEIGGLPVGHYSYSAKTSSAAKTFSEVGEFSISPVQLELTRTKADHQLLYNFSLDHGGRLVYPSELSQLPDLVRSAKGVQAVSHETKILSDLINTRWILWIILALLCLEWLLRKRNGTY
jgi:hypothetical protein